MRRATSLALNNDHWFCKHPYAIPQKERCEASCHSERSEESRPGPFASLRVTTSLISLATKASGIHAAFDKLRQRACPQRPRWLSLSKPTFLQANFVDGLHYALLRKNIRFQLSNFGIAAIYNLKSEIYNPTALVSQESQGSAPAPGSSDASQSARRAAGCARVTARAPRALGAGCAHGAG